MNRRTVLSYTLGSAGLLLAGISSLSFQSTKEVSPSSEPLFLDREYYSILHAIAQTLIPSNPPFPSASEMNIAALVDAVLATADQTTQDQFLQVLWLIENPSLSILSSFHTAPFSQCSPEEQKEILEAWRTSSILDLRSAFKALNGLCNGAYYAQSKVASIVGYPGPPEAIVSLRKARGY